MSDKIEVYIKINEKNEITEINSSVFVSKNDNYIKIDDGCGDKYVHAQNLYLEKPIISRNFEYNYIYKDGKIVEKDL